MDRYLGWLNFNRRLTYGMMSTRKGEAPWVKAEEFVRDFTPQELAHPWARRRGSRPPEEYIYDDVYNLTRFNRTKPYEKEN